MTIAPEAPRDTLSRGASLLPSTKPRNEAYIRKYIWLSFRLRPLRRRTEFARQRRWSALRCGWGLKPKVRPAMPPVRSQHSPRFLLRTEQSSFFGRQRPKRPEGTALMHHPTAERAESQRKVHSPPQVSEARVCVNTCESRVNPEVDQAEVAFVIGPVKPSKACLVVAEVDVAQAD